MMLKNFEKVIHIFHATIFLKTAIAIGTTKTLCKIYLV